MDNLVVSKYYKKYTLQLTINNINQTLWTSKFDSHDIEHLYYKQGFTKEGEDYLKDIRAQQYKQSSTVGKRIEPIEYINPHINIFSWYEFKRRDLKSKCFNVTFMFDKNTLLCFK